MISTHVMQQSKFVINVTPLYQQNLILGFKNLLPTHTPSSESSPGVYEYAYELSDISHIITSLGWIVNDLKAIDFASIVTYVGFTWDIASKQVSLPEKKCIKHLTKLMNVLSSINASAHCHLDPLVNLQGSLSHLCFVYQCGCSRMPALHCSSPLSMGTPLSSIFLPPVSFPTFSGGNKLLKTHPFSDQYLSSPLLILTSMWMLPHPGALDLLLAHFGEHGNFYQAGNHMVVISDGPRVLPWSLLS